jgi:hypothetical protein
MIIQVFLIQLQQNKILSTQGIFKRKKSQTPCEEFTPLNNYPLYKKINSTNH